MIQYTAKVIEIGKLISHPNADNLSIVCIGDFQCVVRTSDWQCGDLGIYIEPDTIVPETKEFEFLGKHRRIKARKLRGEWSVGLLILAPKGAKIGDDYFVKLGLEHWEPNIHGNFTTGGDNVIAPVGIFPIYDVDNFRKYSRLFKDGEEVVATEKTHGCVNSLARISLPNGNRLAMQKLIEQDYHGEVLGYDLETQRVIATKVKRIYKNGLGGQWIKITFDHHRAGRGSYFGSLKCTSNHRIFSVNKNDFVEANRLMTGDTIRLVRSELGLTPIQEQVLIGKMLGDGSYSHNNSAGFVGWSHKKDHEEYLAWTEQALGEICGNRQAECLSGYGTTMVRSRTVSSAFIKNLFNNWSQESLKKVPTSIIPKLGPIALAFWYMDDGSLCHHKGQEDRALFATNGFSERSVDNLILALAKFDIHAVKHNSFGWRLRLNSDDAEKLFLIIAPYVPSIMQYKLPERYRGHPGWMPSKNNTYKQVCVDQQIIKIVHIKENRQRYDLETETHNYFANGVLIHNCNARCVYVDGEMFAGSRKNWKKKDPNNLWWKAMVQQSGVEQWYRTHPNLAIYGENYGRVQNLHYRTSPGEIRFVAFDILKEGKWLDFDEAREIGQSLPWVPLVYRGPFDKEKLLAFAEGDSSYPFAQHYREGVVVKPVHERWDSHLGRVQLKIVGNRYLSKS